MAHKIPSASLSVPHVSGLKQIHKPTNKMKRPPESLFIPLAAIKAYRPKDNPSASCRHASKAEIK
jgi:hypothetical protein